MLTRRLIIVLSFFLSCSLCSGQTTTYSYSVKHFSTNNSKLIHNRIDRLQFDSDFNLVCFSPRGYTKILNWNTAFPIFEPSVNDDIQFGLLHDEKDRIWTINSKLGLSVLSDEDSSVFPSKHKVLGFQEIGFGQMAFYFDNGEVLIYKGEDKQRFIALQKELKYKDYQILLIDSLENIYLSRIKPGDSKDINYAYKFSSEGVLLDYLDMNSHAARLLKNYQPFFHTPYKRLKTEENLNTFLLQNFELFKYSEAPRVFYDKTRQLFWYTNEDTLYGFHPSDGEMHQIKLSNKAVKSEAVLFRNNSIVVGTTDGLFIVKINENHFHKVKSEQKRGYRRIKSIKTGEHYVFTDYRLFQLDTACNLSEKVLGKGKEFLYAAGYVDSKERIWTNIDSSIKLFHKDGGLMKTLYKADPEFRKRFPFFYWGYLEAEDGIVWTIFGNKLLGFEEGEQKYELTLSLPKIENVIEILEEDATFLWVCTSKGLLKVNRFDGTVLTFSKSQKGAQFIPALDIRDIHIDSKGNYWLGTADNGLIKWNYRFSETGENLNSEKNHRAFNVEYGFPSNTINGIEEDDFGFLWLSSENGLIRFHKESNNFEVYTMKDGTSDNEFNRLSHHEDESGTMYFGGISGLTVFHPESFVHGEQKSDLNVRRLFVLDEQKKIDITDDFRDGNLITLDRNDQSIELLYSRTENISSQVSYRLSEDKPWIKDEDNKILLINPPFGSFNIHLKEEDITGEIIGHISIPVQAPLPFYYQIWFYLLLVSGSFALAWLIARWRSAKLRVRQKKLEQVVKERTLTIEQDKQTIEEQARQLKELVKSRAAFFRNLVHDLKNPLTIINGSIQLMKMDKQLRLSNENQKLLAAIRENSSLVLNVSEEILLLAKLQSKKANEVKYAPVSTLLFFEKLFNSYTPRAILEEKSYKLSHNLTKETTDALDTNKLERIVLNLISNAFKNTTKGDEISLSISRNETNKQIQIEVSDTGRGIESTLIPFLFDPFYKAQHEALSSSEGMGIGLTIVKELVDLYKGEITVKSVPEQGSSFTVKLPLDSVEIAAIATKHEESSTNRESESAIVNASFKSSLIHNHLLIVEDDKNVRRFLREFLEPYFLVSTVSSPKEAFEMLRQSDKAQKNQSVTLIITDLLMPNKNGLVFIEELRKNIKWNLLPVIVVSSYDSQKMRNQATELGVRHFLNKPFDPIKLMDCIHESILKNTAEETHFELPAHSYHSQLMKAINEIISERLEDKDLNVTSLSQEIAVSKRQLNRIVKQETGLPPAKYILELKLRRAKELLESKSHSSVSEVSYALGFTSPKYFSQLFKNRFGAPPSAYLAS